MQRYGGYYKTKGVLSHEILLSVVLLGTILTDASFVMHGKVVREMPGMIGQRLG